MEEKLLVIICGPSGSGKTSIAQELVAQNPKLDFSISATTRKPRPNEQSGKDYYFMAQEEFQHAVQTNQLVEFQEVFEGLYYGTFRSELERIWSVGSVPLLDVDVKGALYIKEDLYPNALTIFIHPGSIDNLRSRLSSRGSEHSHEIRVRLKKAEKELQDSDRFQKVIYNDDLLKAKKEAVSYVQAYLKS